MLILDASPRVAFADSTSNALQRHDYRAAREAAQEGPAGALS